MVDEASHQFSLCYLCASTHVRLESIEKEPPLHRASSWRAVDVVPFHFASCIAKSNNSLPNDHASSSPMTSVSWNLELVR